MRHRLPRTTLESVFYSLKIFIVFELLLIFTGTYNILIEKIMFYSILVVFSLLVSYDTSRMFEYAKICIDSPNYPQISTSQTLNILNLFQNFLIRQ